MAPLQGPGRGPNNTLEIMSNFTAHIWKKLDRGFPTFDNKLKNLRDVTNSKLWSWMKLLHYQ